jgi:hypothetical protein
MTIRQIMIIVGIVLLVGPTLAPLNAHAQATPQATPAASPVASSNGCDQLVAYFQELADLTLENEGLVIMRESAFDVLALSDHEAAVVVASIDDVIPLVEAIDAPAPALAYHAAQVEILAWYRALAANRDPLVHQQLINNDRRLFSAIGQAVQIGQTTCGFDVWTDARDAAFESEG